MPIDKNTPKSGPGMSAAKLVIEINSLIVALRAVADEPMSIRYSELVDFEVLPASSGNKILVGREGWGFTTVDYGPEGLTVDVVGHGEITSLHECGFDIADLVAG